MESDTIGSTWLWVAFGSFVVLMLALDLGVFHRKAHEITIKEAAVWSAVWVAISLSFNLFVFLRWGGTAAEAFLTGYLIEKALSVENLFVFYVVFSAFSVEAAYQHKVLFWGIVGALLLRGALVFGGTVLLSRFHWLVYVFGLILMATGVRMLVRRHEPRPQESRLFRALEQLVPTTRAPHGGRLFAREDGALRATPLFLVLLLVELTDVIFSIDSILAIFAITQDPFIVFTSNIFAVMGMRSLYFLLAGMARRFTYLQPGLALVMLFVGTKMAISRFLEIPVVVSLLVVAALLGGSIALSLHKTRERRTAAP